MINEGMRDEINQQKIMYTNLGEGCEWDGELGDLEAHLEFHDRCEYAIVTCPNKCRNKSNWVWSS